MKILHLGDIHLGCTLENLRRNREIENVFRFLIEKVKQENIEAALLAGDIFDSGDPSNESQELYFDFLLGLQNAGCRQVIVIAGNHDSANFLEAPGHLLKRINIHVIGNVDPEHPEKEVIPLGSPDTPAAFVCAVPYLRERDVRKFTPEGESGEEYKNALNAGITEHYRQVFAIADKQRNNRPIPIIGMGHFYANGCSFAAKESKQPVGKLDPVDLDDFASGFDYMALGHIHKPQIIKGHNNRRYAGSILPMTLQENRHAPQFIIIDTSDLSDFRSVEIPDACFHKMTVIKGDLSELRNQLEMMRLSGDDVWVKPVYTGEEIMPNWSIDLRQQFRDTKIQIISPDVQSPKKNTVEIPEEQQDFSLALLTPEKVFLDYLAKKGEVTTEEQKNTLLKLFRQAQEQVTDPANKTESQDKNVPGSMLRFKRLYIKNVNSLYGVNRIDFEAPEFHDGIFLITGRTGAGKSSILDAICLALYGRTPRVGMISDTKDSVMSEGEKEMMAELTFSLGNEEYRASFRHVKLNKRKDGGDGTKLYRTPEHKLYKGGKELPLSKREVGSEIEKLIGMNDRQFTRCVLLSQGNFDAFLKSRPEDRSEILKNITGTEIYTLIGRKINEFYMDEKIKYDEICAAANAIQLLSDEELEQIKKDWDTASETLKALEAEVKTCEMTEAVFKSIDDGNKRVQDAEQALKSVQDAFDHAGSKRTELTDAIRAQICQSSFEEYKHKSAEINTVKKNIALLSCLLPQLEKDLASAQAIHQSKNTELDQIRLKQTEMQKLFQEIRILDARIADARKQEKQAKTDWIKAAEKQKTAEQMYQKAKAVWEDLQKQSGQAKLYIKEHSDDESLLQKQQNWELRRTILVQAEKENDVELAAVNKLQNDLKHLQKQRDVFKNKMQEISLSLTDVLKQLENAQNHSQELLGGMSEDELRSAWAAALNLGKFFQSESLRKEFLKPSQPCPLCGSLSHPYCEGVTPSVYEDYGELAEKIRARLDGYRKIQNELPELQTGKGKLDAQFVSVKTKMEANEAQILAIKENITACEERRNEAVQKISESAKNLADDIFQSVQVRWTDHSSLPQEIAIRIQSFADAQKIMLKRAEGEQAYNAAYHAYFAVAEQNQNELLAKEETLKKLQDDIQTFMQERTVKFGTKTVVEEEKVLLDAVKRAELEQASAAKKLIHADEQVNHNMQDQKKRAELLHQYESELIPLETAWKAKLSESGFRSEDEFTAKRREPQYIQDLNKELQNIRDAVNEKQTALTERKKSLKEKWEKLPSGIDRAANLAELQMKREEADRISEQVKKLEFKLLKDQEAKAASADAMAKMEELRVSYNNWKYLNDHFGSTAVDRFGRIAQGYTFRKLLYFANANRLGNLRRHFTLINDETDPLELNVIDHCRGDLIRTSRNLSGGECFEVSLALALGLADMSAVSQNARLGNVLLDEGFGSLDDNALDSALELLMQLKTQDKKLVGIISHVSKLKEKIEAQIEVTSSSGMGMLSGAGVMSADAPSA